MASTTETPSLVFNLPVRKPAPLEPSLGHFKGRLLTTGFTRSMRLSSAARRNQCFASAAIVEDDNRTALRQPIGNRRVPIFQHSGQMMQKDNGEARLIAYFAIHEVRPVYTDRFGSSRVEGRGHGSFSVHTKD